MIAPGVPSYLVSEALRKPVPIPHAKSLNNREIMALLAAKHKSELRYRRNFAATVATVNRTRGVSPPARKPGRGARGKPVS